MKDLPRFLESNAVTDCAMRLLGCEIVTPDCRIKIVETEAYGSTDDPNSHGYHGITPRNMVMFESTGCAYVYLNYGVHWLFNVTCRPSGESGAVLIRGATVLEGLEAVRARRPKAARDTDLLSGPGKIGAALGVNGDDTWTDLFDPESRVRVVPGRVVKNVLTGPRVGLREGSDQRHWRFIDEKNAQWASSPKI